MAATHKKVAILYLRSLETLVLLLFDRNVHRYSRSSVQQPLHASDLVGGANTCINKRCVYRLLVAMNVAHFIAFCGKLEYGRSGCILAYISLSTRARGFKFAGTPVQRLHLAMVALTQKSFSAHFAWFYCGGSHIVHAWYKFIR